MEKMRLELKDERRKYDWLILCKKCHRVLGIDSRYRSMDVPFLIGTIADDSQDKRDLKPQGRRDTWPDGSTQFRGMLRYHSEISHKGKLRFARWSNKNPWNKDPRNVIQVVLKK